MSPGGPPSAIPSGAGVRLTASADIFTAGPNKVSHMVSVRRFVSASLVLVAVAVATAAAQATPQQVDSVFAAFRGRDGPGCAVAVSQQHREVLARAYGLADLEHEVPNTPETIFEPGSVAKQFTATATILLALDGKLSLDDDIRKYLPEVPDYGTPITIRHLLNHTSGLRDWGAVAAIGGWPRTTRVHTHTHVLDIVAHQRALNYPPGEYYSYTNTGYNLQAILVERVSGMSFAEFTRTRIFEPLGMTHTQWRDDFTRIVPNRAIAYSPERVGGYRMDMPLENVHGNGGLLTTVSDLLLFTHNLETGELGGPRYLDEMHRQGVLNSGRTISYASGLVIGEYRGLHEVQHSGATAGYRGFLTRFPDQGLAVAVMCNAGNASPAGLAHDVADLYLGEAVAAADTVVTPTAVDVPSEQIRALSGSYKRMRDQTPLTLRWVNDALWIGSQMLTPVSATRFVTGGGATLEFEPARDGARPSAVLHTPDGDSMHLEPVPAFQPTATELAEYVGEYHSDEAEVTYRVGVKDGLLSIVDRYGDGRPLAPAYPDAFSSQGGLVIFRRESGRVTGLSVVQGRVWDLRFERVGG